MQCIYTWLHYFIEDQKYVITKYVVNVDSVPVTKCISELGKATRFGPNWSGERCGAKTRRGTLCQRPAYKHNGRCRLHGGASTGARTQEGLKRISEANLRHGRQTKDKLEAQRKRGEVGQLVLSELEKIEAELLSASLIDTNLNPV